MESQVNVIKLYCYLFNAFICNARFIYKESNKLIDHLLFFNIKVSHCEVLNGWTNISNLKYFMNRKKKYRPILSSAICCCKRFISLSVCFFRWQLVWLAKINNKCDLFLCCQLNNLNQWLPICEFKGCNCSCMVV